MSRTRAWRARPWRGLAIQLALTELASIAVFGAVLDWRFGALAPFAAIWVAVGGAISHAMDPLALSAGEAYAIGLAFVLCIPAVLAASAARGGFPRLAGHGALLVFDIGSAVLLLGFV
jgi:hypothetical protein